MARRIFLDAANGQPWSAAALAAVGAVAPQQISAVNGLSNAFRVALSDPSQSVAIAAGARAGMRQAAEGYLSLAEWPLTADGGLTQPLPDADVLCIQAGNPETGVIHDAESIRRERPAAVLVVDASEWVGRLPGLPVGDVLVVRASSWGGPASACFVISNQPSRLNPRSRLSLAPDATLIAAAAAALTELRDVEARAALHRSWLQDFAARVRELPGCRVFDTAPNRLPHLLSFTIDGFDGEALAHELDHRGFAIGSGSACAVDQATPSAVLAAMGETNTASLRIGLPLAATAEDLPQLLVALRELVAGK